MIQLVVKQSKFKATKLSPYFSFLFFPLLSFLAVAGAIIIHFPAKKIEVEKIRMKINVKKDYNE